MPPTSAVPDDGRSSPHSIRMVVDLPAPLLPRKPKISPRATVERQIVDREELAEPPGQATDLDRRAPSPAGGIGRHGRPSARSSRAIGQPCPGDRAGAIQFGLEHAGLRVEDVRVGRDAGGESLADHTLRLDRRAHAVFGRGDGRQRRVHVETPLLDLERELPIEIGAARGQHPGVRRGFGLFGAAAAAVPERPADVDRASQESCHSSMRGKMRGFGRA